MKLLCVFGPTACHKSETALSLAQELDGEILSCDSVAVYRGFDIGSAKPTKEEQAKIPHHLIDIVDPTDQSFSVSTFQKAADRVIYDCFSRGKLPILAGGTGMYADGVLRDMRYAVPGDSSIRNALSLEYEQDRVAFVQKLKEIDFAAGNRIPLNDKKRLVRAMEVYMLTGRPFSSYNDEYEQARKRMRYDSVRIGLTMDRQTLYQRIDQRVDRMLETGLLDEARALHDKFPDRNLPAVQSIGYAQLFDYFDGKCSLEAAVERIKLDSRHLAKRQLTWFKRDEGIRWFTCDDWPLTLGKVQTYCKEALGIEERK